MDLPPKCLICPVTLPACGGQLLGALCAPDNAATIDATTGLPAATPTDDAAAAVLGSKLEGGKTASAIYYGWPATA